ncbi:hypothetical protein GCM10018773_39190 [Streptomyces candidus]|nr:hypothetical protein GCM10018773_39190 [Streptomyces candidus]
MAVMLATMPRDGSYLHPEMRRSREPRLLPPTPGTEPPVLVEELELSVPPDDVEEPKPPVDEVESPPLLELLPSEPPVDAW